VVVTARSAIAALVWFGQANFRQVCSAGSSIIGSVILIERYFCGAQSPLNPLRKRCSSMHRPR